MTPRMPPRIIAARRTAVAPRGGAFAALRIEDLAGPVVQAVLADAGLSPTDVDEVICANALGAGGNPARRLALAAGLPERVAGLSIDRQCAGGLDAIESDQPDRPLLTGPSSSQALPSEMSAGEVALEEARKLTRDNPAAVANIVKTWINGEAPA